VVVLDEQQAAMPAGSAGTLVGVPCMGSRVQVQEAPAAWLNGPCLQNRWRRDWSWLRFAQKVVWHAWNCRWRRVASGGCDAV